MAKQRTEVADIDRSLYDFSYGDSTEKLEAGLTPEIVREISEKKDEPEWMLQHRLKSLEIYQSMPTSDWGPSIAGLDMDNIVTYVKPNTDQKSDWDSLPDDVKNTFDRLGIPEAERSYLAGVGAQYDSELVYHNMQDTASRMGIVYSGIEEALHDPQWEPLIREKFMTLIPPTDHKFAALHGAVWSGGSFVYVPKDTKLDFPLGCSAPKYNVANLHAGAVELFVGKNAHLRYSTIENWSKNMYNLNTKRSTCDEGGSIEWVSGSFGIISSCVTDLAPRRITVPTQSFPVSPPPITRTCLSLAISYGIFVKSLSRRALVTVPRKSTANHIPFASLPGTLISLGDEAPQVRSTLSYVFRSSSALTSFPTSVFTLKITPSSSIRRILRSTTDFSSFIFGIPYRSRPPGRSLLS